MLKNLKTSSKISLKFTFFTVIIILLFGVFANFVFFQMRYRSVNIEAQWEKMAIKERYLQEPSQWPEFQNFRDKFINRLSITTDSTEYKELQKNEFIKWYWISRLWSSYFYFHAVDNTS